jgi:hypothetical protein
MSVNFDQRTAVRKRELVGVLEQLCEELELSNSQYALAKERYEGVGQWLAAADSPLLQTIEIYLQGSTALGTTVKPIKQNEHDVDLVCHLPDLGLWLPPSSAKKLIGDRLRANGHYVKLLEEKDRCWRLNYVNEFHLDITPSIINPACATGGELVPDKALKEWKSSNPRGYKALFEYRARLAPRIRAVESFVAKDSRANVEPYPRPVAFKGVLRRSVQLAKRHRDIQFTDFDPRLAPLSVIITTLISRSYQYCVQNIIYDSELDLLADIIRHMPDFIESSFVGGTQRWFVWNETTSGENFAEKWNSEPDRAEAFFAWHAGMMSDVEGFAEVQGLDQLTRRLSGNFGSAPVNKAMDSIFGRISGARSAGRLSVAPGIGLTVGNLPNSTAVRTNTFFGAE